MITDKVGGSSAKPEVSKQSKEKRLKHKVSGYKSQSKWRSIAGCRLLLRTLITKVEIDRSFLKLVCFVSSILTTCSKWEHKTHKLDLWEKSLCKKMLTWSYHPHFCHWFSQSRWAHISCKKKEWRKTGVKTSEARENKQKNPFIHRWWETL